MKHIKPDVSKLHVVSQLVAQSPESNKNSESSANNISASKIGVGKAKANKIGARKPSPVK